ncbi:MAG: aminotransferase class V-fold PLP-dependent enzyme [Verrucomicrobiota bacterium]
MKSKLALYGGDRIKKKPFPPRRAFHEAHLKAVKEVFNYYKKAGVDFGYQGEFEKRYTQEFAEWLGGGYADAVNTGSGAVFVALAALGLKPGSEVLVSPISDPGTYNAVVMNRLTPKLMDSAEMNYNVGVKQFSSRINERTKAVLIVHATGKACPIEEIAQIARERKIFVVEDCSQAHGAKCHGRYVGTFGDIAAFSTMYRKNHCSGGCGGLVFTKDLNLHQMARAHADRGKPYWIEGFDEKNPNQFLFPAMNFNQDEVSCAIGLASLKELEETNHTRREFLRYLHSRLILQSRVCRFPEITDSDAPFFQPIMVDVKKLNCTKLEFAKAVQAEGISINPHYQYLAQNWPYLKSHWADDFQCSNAEEMLNHSLNLLFHEGYTTANANDIVRAIVKVESVLALP